MFTTSTADGRLYSRPLTTQQIEPDGHLWFATDMDSEKVDEVQQQPRVNVSYASASKNTYVSVTGKAKVLRNQAKIDELWTPAMKIFFPKGKDDPNLGLIRVAIESAEYWDGPSGVIGKAIYLVAAAVTENPGVMSDHGTVDLGKKR